MKYNFKLLFILLLALGSVRAQIPNGGFEEWASEINPDHWAVSISPEFNIISKTSDSHSGQWAVKGECMPYSKSDSTIIAPYLGCSGDLANGFPVNSRYISLKGYYKLIPNGSDRFYILVNFFLDTINIGHGYIELPSSSDYSQFIVPIYYNAQGTPNSCTISIGINLATLGSEMYVDDLEFGFSEGNVSGLQNDFKLFSFHLDQNYPNPFNPSTKISWQSPVSSWQTLKVYDVLGKEVATLVDEYRSAGSYEVKFNAANLPSGTYFYQLKAGDFIQTNKMILMK